MAAPRAKNCANPAQVCRVLKANLSYGKVERWLAEPSYDNEEFAESFFEALKTLLRLTPRPVKTCLAPGIVQAFSLPEAKAGALGSTMLNCISHACNTSKSMTSGTRTARGLRVIINTLRDIRLGDRLPASQPPGKRSSGQSKESKSPPAGGSCG